jgi:radical SAM protein with 4Fe4S-binding SPASM domain
MAYRLHPDIAIRNDVDRNIIYVINPVDSLMPDMVRSLSTPASLLLALFDGKRPLSEVTRIWSQLLFGRPPDQQVYRKVQEILLTDLNPEMKIKDIIVKSDPNSEAVEVVPDICQLIVKKSLVNLEDPRLRIPLRLLFIPTLHCTQRCYYCYSTDSYPGAGEPLHLDRLTEIFQEAKGLGIEVIDISGGEPLSYPHIVQLIKMFSDLSLIPNIPTKYPLTRTDIEHLKEAGLKSLQISIDAIDPGLLEVTTGVKDYGRRIVQTFHELEEAGIKLRINSVITPFNMHDIVNLTHFLTTFSNIYRVSFSPYAKSRFHHDDTYFISQEMYSDLVKRAEDIMADFPHIKFFPGEIPSDSSDDDPIKREETWNQRAFCTGGRHAFVLLPDGKVTMCEELYYHPAYIMGDLSRQSIREMWNSEAALRISYPDKYAVPDGSCRDCLDFKACHIAPGRCVREAIKQYGQERHYYPDPRCPHAPPG